MALLSASTVISATKNVESETSSTSDAEKRQTSSLSHKLDKLVDETVDRLEKIRGLKPKATVKGEVKNRKQIREYLQQQLEKNNVRTQIESESIIFKRLALLPDDFKYRESFLELMTSQVAGFYDSESQKLNILDEVPATFQKHALAHEVFHAIQDQHFDIRELTKSLPAGYQNSDLVLARKALLEGDASLVMLDHLFHEKKLLPVKTNDKTYRSLTDIPQMRSAIEKKLSSAVGPMIEMNSQSQNTPFGSLTSQFKGDSSLSSMPNIITAPLLFPYLKGMRFVLNQKKPGDVSSVNRVYRLPPDSTEQILHPEKYNKQDTPTSISTSPIPDRRAERYNKIYGNTFGEFMLRVALQTYRQKYHSDKNPAPVTPTKAAAGWDGDRVLLYRSRTEPRREVITHVSVWDTIKDAIEYFRFLKSTFQKRFKDSKAKQAPCFEHRTNQRTHFICLEQFKGKVLLTDYISPPDFKPKPISKTKKDKSQQSFDPRVFHRHAKRTISTQPLHQHLLELRH